MKCVALDDPGDVVRGDDAGQVLPVGDEDGKAAAGGELFEHLCHQVVWSTGGTPRPRGRHVAHAQGLPLRGGDPREPREVEKAARASLGDPPMANSAKRGTATPAEAGRTRCSICSAGRRPLSPSFATRSSSPVATPATVAWMPLVCVAPDHQGERQIPAPAVHTAPIERFIPITCPR